MPCPRRFILVLHTRLNAGARKSRNGPRGSSGDDPSADLSRTASDLYGHLAGCLSLSVGDSSGDSSSSSSWSWGRLVGDGAPQWTSDPEAALSANLSSQWHSLRQGEEDGGRGAALHRLLDAMPRNLAFLFDVLWLVPKYPSLEETPVEIYSALKRARDWHGANIVLVPLADFLHRPNDVLDDLRAETLVYNDVGAEALTEFLDEKMIWRGNLSLYDGDSFCYRHLPGFELVASDERSQDIDCFSPSASVAGGKKTASAAVSRPLSLHRLSAGLRVLARCDRRRIPAAVFTDRQFVLRTSLQAGDDVAEDLLQDRAFFSAGRCLLVALDYCTVEAVEAAEAAATSTSAGAKAAPGSRSRKRPRGRTSEDWRQCVADGVMGRSLDENLARVEGKSSLYFVVFEDLTLKNEMEHRNVAEKSAVLLDPSALPLAESLSSRISAAGLDIDVDGNRRAELFSSFRRDANPCFGEEKEESEEVQEADWPERRLLAEVEHFRKAREREGAAAARNGVSETMTPSGEFVVLEAKELLKFFDENADPRHPEKLEPVRPRRVPLVHGREEVDSAAWPEMLYMEHPGLHYNRGDLLAVRDAGASLAEEADRECQRLQRLFIGPFRETASTCISLGGATGGGGAAPQTVVVSKQQERGASGRPSSKGPGGGRADQRNTDSPLTLPMASPPRSRRSSTRRKPLASLSRQEHQREKEVRHPPRRQSSSTTTSSRQQQQQQQQLSRDEIFRRKVRNAVFDALSEQGVDERHVLFKPCFRKLFSICRLYGGEDHVESAAAAGGTKKFLTEVARSNARLTIAMEKKTLSQEQKQQGSSLRKEGIGGSSGTPSRSRERPRRK